MPDDKNKPSPSQRITESSPYAVPNMNGKTVMYLFVPKGDVSLITNVYNNIGQYTTEIANCSRESAVRLRLLSSGPNNCCPSKIRLAPLESHC